METIPDSVVRGKARSTFLIFDIKPVQSSGIVVPGFCIKSKKPGVVLGGGGSRVVATGTGTNQCQMRYGLSGKRRVDMM